MSASPVIILLIRLPPLVLILGTRTDLLQTGCIVPVCNVVGLLGLLLLDVGLGHLLGGGLDIVRGTTVLLVLL